MKTKYSKLAVIFSFVIFSFFVIGCDNASSSSDHSSKPDSKTTEDSSLYFSIQPVNTLVSLNQKATLTCQAETDRDTLTYQWYSCDDNEKTNAVPIAGATEATFETPAFKEKSIRYYYCLAKDDIKKVSSSVVAAAYTGLPSVYITTPDKAQITSKEVWMENATISISSAQNNDWNFEPVTTSIRGRGNTTWGLPKKPYAIKLDKKKEIMGMPAHKRWVLIANYLDNSFIRNSMAFYYSEIFEMDYTVKGQFVDLFMNGEYAGLYWFGEAIKVDSNRININDGSKKMSDSDDKDYLIELDVYFDEPVKFRSSIRDLPYMIKNDDYMIDDNKELTSGGQARLERLQNKITTLENLLYPDAADVENLNACSAPDETYAQIIDIESWAKFWCVNELMDNGEIKHPKSCYFTFDSENDIFKAGPVWDYDNASLWKNSGCRLQNTIYYNALFKSPVFKNRVKTLWEQYSDSINIESKVEAFRNEINLSADLDEMIWGVNHNPQDLVCSDYNEHIDFVKKVLKRKFTVVSDEINSENFSQ